MWLIHELWCIRVWYTVFYFLEFEINMNQNLYYITLTLLMSFLVIQISNHKNRFWSKSIFVVWTLDNIKIINEFTIIKLQRLETDILYPIIDWLMIEKVSSIKILIHNLKGITIINVTNPRLSNTRLKNMYQTILQQSLRINRYWIQIVWLLGGKVTWLWSNNDCWINPMLQILIHTSNFL